MCTQKRPHDNSAVLYERYGTVFSDYIELSVLPALRNCRDEALLRELARRWDGHKLMTKWFARFFNYLDRYYVCRYSLTPLKEAAYARFADLVCRGELGTAAAAAAAAALQSGVADDRALAERVLRMFVELEMGEMACGAGTDGAPGPTVAALLAQHAAK